MRLLIAAVGRLKKKTPEEMLISGYVSKTRFPVEIKEVEEKRLLPPDQLKKAVLVFRHDTSGKLACVQAKLNYYNSRQNWLTRFFTVEYTTYFDLVLAGWQRFNIPLPLGGTSNHFRT